MTPPKERTRRVTMADLADAINNHEYAYLEMALLEYEQTRSAKLRQHLRAALDFIGSYGDEASYYFRKGLQVTLDTDTVEYDKKVAERRKLYEDNKVKR